MANTDIIAEFNQHNLSNFRKDFAQMIKAGAEIDRYYGYGKNLDTYIPKYERLAGQFNKKYSGLRITTKKTLEHFKVMVFVKESNVKDFFANSASRIAGLKSAGKASFSQAETSNMEKFAKFLETVHDKIFVSYADAASGTSTLAASFNAKEKMVEILYEPEEIMHSNSASFRVCAYYALKNEVDWSIDVYSEASTFGFYNLLDEIEKREWVDRFKGK